MNSQDAPCFHCGQPVPPGSSWTVTIGDEPRVMCCPGCEAVAHTIVSSGLSDYYLTRDAYSSTVDGDVLVPPELKIYDSEDAMRGFAETGDAVSMADAVFSVENIRCAACVWLIEKRLSALPGVRSANLNVATERLSMRWDTKLCKPSGILGTLRSIGYVAYPYDPARHAEQLQKAGKKLFRQVFIAGLSMMQVMMYAVPVYMATDGTMEADMEQLMRWASLLLTLPAIFYCALPFFSGAWAGIKSRVLGMDVPVALGIAAAFGGSVVATVRGQGEVYFDSVTMFIFLLLCSRYLELLARRKAAFALERLQHALPASAARVVSYPENRDTETVAAARLTQGDVILIRPGEPVAADCVILEGSTAVDMSLLSGESVPVRKGPGDMLPGGTVNASQAVFASVARPSHASTLSALIKLIERAGQAKPRLAQWADRIAAWFVTGLLLFAVMVFFAWHWIDPARAWPIAIAVLVVSCPCALSLATPSALAAATDRLVREGVLIVQPHVLETLFRTTHVVFDKTGTLTVGKPRLCGTDVLGAMGGSECLAIAGAIESASAHPLGIAIADAARGLQQPLPQVTDLRHVAGQGMEARCGGTLYRLGSAAFVRELAGGSPYMEEDDGISPVYLGSATGWHARLGLADALRPEAAQLVDEFRRQGKEVILLSGDRQSVTEHVAKNLGISTARGECLPEQKLAFVQALQEKGGVVAMVGDGINDAAVLRAADVSFAMGNGAALAQTHADAVLLSGHLASVGVAHAMAARTMAVIRQNLAWASLYNLVAIPAAAFGLLNPWLSGIGMSASSAIVVINALRLRRVARPCPAGACLAASRDTLQAGIA